MNFSDSEVVASILKKEGYDTTPNPNEANLILINTCSIREKAEQTVRARLKSFLKIKQKNPKGCGAVKRRSIPKTLPEWSNLGFKTINDTQLPQRSDLEARLVAPDGVTGRMFLVYPNYKNIL